MGRAEVAQKCTEAKTKASLSALNSCKQLQDSGQTTSVLLHFQMVDPRDLTLPLGNDSVAAATPQPSRTDDSLPSSGIIPGAIAASVFIVFLLALYAVLWKCMVSPPKRKKRKSRVRGHQQASV